MNDSKVNWIQTAWQQLFRLPRKFDDPLIEARFMRERLERFATSRRLSGMLGLWMWLTHIWGENHLRQTDPVFAAHADDILLLRLVSGVLSGIPLILSISKRLERDTRFADGVILGSSVPIAIASIVMIMIAPHPYDGVYYFPGLIVVMIYYGGMFRLQASRVLALLAVVATLSIGLMWLRQAGVQVGLPGEALYIKVFIASVLASTVFTLIYVISVQLERSDRVGFASQYKLDVSNQALTARNEEVDRLHQKMTILMNEALSHTEARLLAEEKHRSEVEQRNRDKSRFLALAVHDLKQPLQAMGNALFVAIRDLGAGRGPQALSSLTLAQAASKQMRDQLSAILDVSRIESGAVMVRIETLDIVELIGLQTLQLKRVAMDQGVVLTTNTMASGSLYVRTDRQALERILQNLVGNAIKYRHSKDDQPTWVKINYGVDPNGMAFIAVEDNGVGMSDDVIATGAIFQPFFQIENNLPSEHKGVGLGLTLVRALVQSLPEHQIDVSSVLGHGSRFTLRLPACDRNEVSQDDIEGQDDMSMVRLDGKFVMVVEDDELVNKSTCALLERAGALTESCLNCEQLIDRLKGLNRSPDLLITDYRLPRGFTATDVCDKVRNTFPDVPVIVVTGELGELDDARSISNSRLVRKPLSAQVLLSQASAMMI